MPVASLATPEPIESMKECRLASVQDEPAPVKRERYQHTPRSFNVALLRIVDGKGSTLEHLAEITGLSIDSLKGKIKRARYDYTDEERDGPANDLDSDERRYFARYYGRESDPEVQEFLSRISTCTRQHPDWRSSHDGDGRSVGPKTRPRKSA
jgi:hypothetical protein